MSAPTSTSVPPPFDLATVSGLSDGEVAERLASDGPNELPASRPRSLLGIAVEVVREPMFLLLVAAASIYLALGDFTEGMLLLAFVLVVMGITLYQQRKTERALEALRDLSSPRALVIRNGERKRIPGREVVRDDILMLAEGDRVPADALLIEGTALTVDESLLTGESVPVRKHTGAPAWRHASGGSEASAWRGTPDVRPGGDDLPFLYSGTLVVQGQGVAQVYATGMQTELGKIGRALQAVEAEATGLERETRQIVRWLAAAGLVSCLLVIVVYALTRGSWVDGLLAGITLAMATLPEEFPVVLTIFLALGAWRLSQRQVLTRRVAAVETLGAATVLCVDKTGTLTLNQMDVRKLRAGGSTWDVRQEGHDLPEAFHEVMEFAILASHRDPFDPMEKAFKRLGEHYLRETEHLHEDWTLVREYPLSRELFAMSRVWKSRETDDLVIASKGAPEAIADLCHVSRGHMDVIVRDVARMASEGLRVLGVARASRCDDCSQPGVAVSPETLPGEQHDFVFEFLGLVGLEDPVRGTAVDAMKECESAGIRVVMITGDYPGTATNIARQIGLRTDKVVTGHDLDVMGVEELRQCVAMTNVFARVVPEQKLKLVEALKANGEVVAMTGDGVNDAPALKSAHIGIAMGGRGTDVAREASSLVLLDDDFTSIVRAVRLGRRIFDNLKKAMAYIFAIHVPIAGMSLLPVLFQWPLALFPVHIVFLELIIDPACSVVFEAEAAEADVMRRPPRDRKERLFGWRTLSFSLAQGVAVLLAVLVLYAAALYFGYGDEEARALSFSALIVANVGLIFVNRSWTENAVSRMRIPNKALWLVTGGALAFLACSLYVPALRRVFRFAYLHPPDVALCVLVGIASVLWVEVAKAIAPRVK